MRLGLLVLCFALIQGQNGASENQKPTPGEKQPAKAESTIVPEENAVKAGNSANNNQANTAHWSDPIVLLQLLLFIAVLAQAGVYVWQAILMRRTLAMLKRQADSLDKAGETEVKQLAAMQDQIDITRESVKQSERALLASESQAETAKQSVEIAKETFYIGERPYFGITHFSLELGRHVNGDYAPRLVIHFQNGGKTPAWKFYAHVSLVLGDSPHSPERWQLNSTEPNYELRYFATGASHTFVFQRIDRFVTNAQMAELAAGNSYLFIVVHAEYQDMRGERLTQSFVGVRDAMTPRVSDWHA